MLSDGTKGLVFHRKKYEGEEDDSYTEPEHDNACDKEAECQDKIDSQHELAGQYNERYGKYESIGRFGPEHF